MIHYDTSFYNLIGTRADGSTFQANPISNPKEYAQMVATLNRQQEAARESQQDRDDYIGRLAAYNTNVQAGRTSNLTPPIKPLKEIISDEGVSKLISFDPPLPDPLPITKPVPGGFGGLNPTGNTDDLTIIKQQLVALTSICQEMLTIIKKISI